MARGKDKDNRFGYEPEAELEQDVQKDSTQELTLQEHIPFFLTLMRAIESVRVSIEQDWDGGVMSLVSLTAVLPPKLRTTFENDIEYFEDMALSNDFNSHITVAERGNRYDIRLQRVNWAVVNTTRRRYAIEVGRCLAGIIAELDKQGMLWKSRSELVGGVL